MKPHKHAELIKAWADGAEIQQRVDGEEWHGFDGRWTDRNNWEFRLKPATITVTIPKPVLVALQSDVSIAFRFESVEDAEKARDAIKELMK